MKRRQFITLIGGAAAWPLTARAQQAPRPRRIVVMMSSAEGDPEGESRAAALRQGLQELGWMEGQNLRIDWFWSGGDLTYIRGYTAALAMAAPDVVVANGRPNLEAVRQAIRTTPIVFVIVNDPVGSGFISSFPRPGGNITGFTFVEYSMLGKLLELLKQAAPGVTRVGVIFNPDTAGYYDQFLPAFEADARQHAVAVAPARVRTEAEINAAVGRLASSPGGGLIVPPVTTRWCTAS
jgi:putative ABC transport system substrate-binding protein